MAAFCSSSLSPSWLPAGSLAEDRNAGGFLDGLHQVFDFPAEVFTEAWAKLCLLPGIFVAHIPALIETLNIAAVATLLGALAAMALSLLATRGLARWPAPDPGFPPHAWTPCAPSRKSSWRWC